MVNPYAVSLRTSWTAGSIRAALTQHREGDFTSSSQLFESMLEDDELPSTLAKRINATLRSEFDLKPAEGVDPEAESPADEAAEADWCKMVPDGQLFELVAYWLMLGVAVATVDWDTSGERWVPKLRVLPPEFLTYDTIDRRWYYTTERGRELVTPGDGRWLLLVNGERGWVWGLIRGLAILWLTKQLTLQDWTRYNTKHGLPIMKAKVPVFAAEGEKAQFIEDLGAMQSEGIIGLPQMEHSASGQAPNYDVELLEATDTSWETFQNNLARADRKIQCAILGSNIGTEQSADTGGSRAAAETSVAQLDQTMAKSDAKYLGAFLQEQLLRPYYAINFGEDAPVPFPRWDVCPEEDARAWQEARTQFVQMLGALPAAGYRLANLEEVASEFGLELEESEQGPVADRPPEPAPAGQPPLGGAR